VDLKTGLLLAVGVIILDILGLILPKEVKVKKR